MSEHSLTRRTLLLAASTSIFFLSDCAGTPAKPASKSTPTPQFPRGLLQIPSDTITPARLGVNIYINESFKSVTF
jgi:hypothetical protein